jgi:hypothetical protein
LQSQFAFPHNPVEARDFRRQHSAAQRAQSVVTAARIVVSGFLSKILDQPPLDHLLQVIVKRPRTEPVLPFRLPLHFLHDGVPMQLLARQRKQNMQSRRRKRQERTGIFFHNSAIVISKSESVVNSG